MINRCRILLSYWRAKRRHFTSRAQLEAFQHKKIQAFIQRLQKEIPYFSTFKSLSWDKWPLMDKSILLANFDELNVPKFTLAAAMQAALHAEQSRDFAPTIGAYSVGLSSGTTAQRGVFIVSAKEKADWAGIILAKALPNGLFSREKVALFFLIILFLFTIIFILNLWIMKKKNT